MEISYKGQVVFRSVLICVLFALSLSGCKPQETVLEPGRVQVIIAEDALKNVRFAAQEMTNFLSRVLGAEVPIVEKGKESKSKVEVEERMVSVFLGEGEWTRRAGLDVAQLKEDGYFIRSVPDGVVIAGVDDADEDPFAAIRTGFGKGARHATLNGVYGFLERYAGCRFYFPGELGEIVPRKGRIAFSADVRDEPVFDFRCSSGPYANTIWFPPQGPAYRPPRQLNWYRLRTSGRDRPLVHGVRHMQLWRRFGKDHPDWFVGKDTAQLCWSSAIKDEIAKDAIAYLRGGDAASRGYVREKNGRYDAKGWPAGAFFPGLVCVDADDGYVQCKCATCAAAVTAWTNAHPKASAASGLMWSAWKEIGGKVKATGAKGRLFALAYSAYQDLPDIDLCDNLFVGCARMGGWSYGAQDRYRKELGDVRAWAEKTHGKTHLHNWSLKWSRYNIPGLPCCTPKAVAQYYRDVAPYACSVLNETTSDRYAHIYLNDYMMAKTTWDPSFDAEAALAEHHRLMFGAAAPEMARFYAELEELWLGKVMSGELVMLADGPKVVPPNLYEIWREVYSPARIAAWKKLFDDGAAKLGDGSLERRRLDLMRGEILEPLARLSDEFIAKCDVAREDARRKASGSKNLLPEGLAFHYEARTEKDMDKCPWKIVPFQFKTNTTYRLSCYIRTKNVVEKWWHASSGATVGIWDSHNGGWTFAPGPIAIRGSTGGWVHASCIRHIGAKTDSKGISIWLRQALGEMDVKGLFLEEWPEKK